MFKRNKVPQRKEFSFELHQIEEDIGNILSDPEQVRKLYACLDEKPPKQEKRFVEVQTYLQETDTLVDTTNVLKDLISRLRDVEKEIASRKEYIIKESKHLLKSKD